MAWMDDLADALEYSGRRARHEAGDWLPWRAESPVIRRIVSGRVGIEAETESGWRDIGEYGPGEWLGIRSALHPDLPPRLRWRAIGPAECEEYDWADIKRRMRQQPELRMALEQMARERLYGAIVATHPLFSLLDRGARKRLFKHAMVRMLAPGECLIEQQGPRPHLYLVASGRLRIERDGQLLALRGRGEIVGEMSVFGFSEHPTADVTAAELTEVIEFRDGDVMDVARGSAAFQRKLADICRTRLLEILRMDAPD